MAWFRNEKLEWVIRILQRMERRMAIDTSKLLAAVEKSRSESASLIALIAAKDAVIANVQTQLTEAMAQLQAQGADIAQLAAIKADIEKATTDLSADDDAVQAALEANIEQPPVPQDGG